MSIHASQAFLLACLTSASWAQLWSCRPDIAAVRVPPADALAAWTVNAASSGRALAGAAVSAPAAATAALLLLAAFLLVAVLLVPPCLVLTPLLKP